MSYPNSDLSAWQLTLIALVMLIALAAWLILVYAAARESRRNNSDARDAPATPTDTQERPNLVQLESREAKAA
jgi:uncharacterized MAPEG superfamily protein